MNCNPLISRLVNIRTMGAACFLALSGWLNAQSVSLNIHSSNGQEVVSWPQGLSLVQPQKSTNLAAKVWSDFGAAITNAGLTNVSGEKAAFYRLRFLAPVITQSPQSLTNATGGNAAFSVTAIGTAPLAYQWRKEGGVLSGETNALLTLPNVTPQNAGNYTVVVSNHVGSVISSAAGLSVTNPIVRPAGIYMGNFSGEADNGGFAALLGSNGIATVVGYNGIQEEGIYAANISVAQDGTFSTSTFHGGTVNGTFTATGVSGSFIDSLGQSGSFSGSRKPDSGIHAADAGYYSGTYNGLYSGSAYNILAADGTAFFFTSGSSGDGGGYGAINAANSFSATTVPDGLAISGSLNSTTLVVSGNYSSSGHSLGNFTLSRTLTQ